jgi:alkyl hydroperoxide reductase subunit F
LNKYDVIIIGAGPAGIAASIYASRKHLKTLTLTKDIGGQATISLNVKDYAGFQFISADELIKKFEEHQKSFGLEVKYGVQVDFIEKVNNEFRVSIGSDSYFSKSVIIATGREPKKLGINGELKFLGRGVTYCATCDAPFFKDKIVGVVGSGSSALYSVIQLLSIAKKIFLINNSDKLSGDYNLVKKIKGSEKVNIINNTDIEEIIGEMVVKSITIKNRNGVLEDLALDGLFIEIGSEPVIPLLKMGKKILKTNSKHEIVIDESCKTNIPGIFASGDVTNVPEKQVLIAAGQGCISGLSAFRYINR